MGRTYWKIACLLVGDFMCLENQYFTGKLTVSVVKLWHLKFWIYQEIYFNIFPDPFVPSILTVGSANKYVPFPHCLNVRSLLGKKIRMNYSKL